MKFDGKIEIKYFATRLRLILSHFPLHFNKTKIKSIQIAFGVCRSLIVDFTHKLIPTNLSLESWILFSGNQYRVAENIAKLIIFRRRRKCRRRLPGTCFFAKPAIRHAKNTYTFQSQRKISNDDP